jgi:signal peptidase I
MGLFASMPKGVRTVVETAVTLAIALAIAWLAQAFVIKPYRVPTPSMVPTLLPGDRVLADRLTLDFGTPHRYQIVVFHPPHCTAPNSDGMGVCTSPDRTFRDGLAGTTFIKRVIGLPGETLWSQDGKIWVQDAGKPKFSLDEPYVNDHQEVAGRALQRVEIPKGYYLLMGDNRGISDDSRDWGLEPRDGIIGVARARYWPIRRIGTL